MKTCTHCGKDFEATRPDKRHCSHECVQEAYKTRMRKEYRAVRPKPPPSEAEIRRCLDALGDGVPESFLRERFSNAVLEAARAMRRGAA